MSETYILEPQVDATAEFLEIARDFTNPMEAVREAISNAFDAHAKQIKVHFSVDELLGEGVLIVVFEDDGDGMDKRGLQSFFDLGNSLTRGRGDGIGSKGHGTKVFLGCEELTVETIGADGVPRRAIMRTPLATLQQKKTPRADVEEGVEITLAKGSRITLRGFNRNRRDIFTHENLKDYIRWFTKFGTIELEFSITNNTDVKLELKGVDRQTPEDLPIGHVFAAETPSMSALFDEHLQDAPKHFARKWIDDGVLRNHPEIRYQAVFAIEGDAAKRQYNKMLSAQGRARLPGMYKVTERYGLHLCKDFIPIERTDGWLGSRSTDHLLYHAFINCQGLQLTANRSSVKNTPKPILDDLREVTDKIRQQIMDTEEYRDVEYLAQQAEGFETKEREKKQYKKRVKDLGDQKTTVLDGVRLIEPRQESGVFALVTQLMILKKDLFPFAIVDYDTYNGIDALVKTRDAVAVAATELRFVEFKYLLERRMNHSFDHIYAIVCWRQHHTIKNQSDIEDLGGEKRRFTVVPGTEDERTRFFLDAPRVAHKIEVFVLETLLKEALGLHFRHERASDNEALEQPGR